MKLVHGASHDMVTTYRLNPVLLELRCMHNAAAMTRSQITLKPFAKPERTRISRVPREKIYLSVYLENRRAVSVVSGGWLCDARTHVRILLTPGGWTISDRNTLELGSIPIPGATEGGMTRVLSHDVLPRGAFTYHTSTAQE